MITFALAFGKQVAMTDALHRWATATSALSSNPRGSRMFFVGLDEEVLHSGRGFLMLLLLF